MGLYLGATSFGVHPDHDDLETADRMWPIIKGALEHLIFDGRDYLVEGVNLRPQTLANFVHETDEPVRVCFLGYPEAVIDTKAMQVAEYAGAPNDWLNRTEPANVRRYLEISRSLSRRLREDCATLGLPFHDTGTDFHGGIASAERGLVGLSAKSSESP